MLIADCFSVIWTQSNFPLFYFTQNGFFCFDTHLWCPGLHCAYGQVQYLKLVMNKITNKNYIDELTEWCRLLEGCPNWKKVTYMVELYVKSKTFLLKK